jgi:3-oxoacyl-[acyl-carrier-protein] synthase II
VNAAVITGMGVVSPFGIGRAAFGAGLTEGRSAVGPIRCFDASAFPTRVAGEVPVPHPTAPWLAERLAGQPRGEALVHALQPSGALRDRKVAWGLVAAAEAWRQSGCGDEERGAWLSIGLGLEQAFLGDFAAVLADGALDWSRDVPEEGLQIRYRAPVDVCARAVRELLALRGPTAVHASACAAGTLAVAHGASLVQRGAASVVLCGASDSMVNPLGIGGFARLGAPSPRHEADACRPFDRRRDGLAIGEGAAMFVVEAEARARARGASVLARVLGWGSTQDAYRATAPRPDGAAAALAMQRALSRARLGPRDIGYLNAHGTGTPLNDPAECRAIRAAFGGDADRVPLSSIKGAIGHLMAAAGAVEAAACLFALGSGLLPGTAHHRERDPACDLDVIGEAPRPARVDVTMSNSFGFGGQNATVILGRAT